ncbi:MAG: hypothetical protein LBR83_03855 [Clostridiales bacterium]|jgi:uncharacterized protein YaaQ|nr:hypothetical protein [Clostridiales bacterium]
MLAEHPCESLVLKLLMVIVDDNDCEKVTHFLRDRFVRFQFACTGEGTANSELQSLLGLNGKMKSLCVSLLPDFHAEELIRILPDELELRKSDKGIAFTIPLSSISNPLLRAYSDEIVQKISGLLDPAQQEKLASVLRDMPETIERKTEKEPLMDTEIEKPDIQRHDLVVAVVNNGCSEELMDVARANGAGGGTVVNARRTGLDENGSFLGLPVQKQKEIILILIEQKKKTELMKAINHGFGFSTPARGIVFSLPVDSVAGLHGGK